MNTNSEFHSEHALLKRLRHYLPAQSPLKDFIHHNTLHAFQHLPFFDALHQAQAIFGYKTNLSLREYRSLFSKGSISDEVLHHLILEKGGLQDSLLWRDRLLTKEYSFETDFKVGKLRSYWETIYKIDLNRLVHPTLFRLIGSYLDQGIAIWDFPVKDLGFYASVYNLYANSKISLFKSKLVNSLFKQSPPPLSDLLTLLLGDPNLFEAYLFDLQFAHQGWSGMVNAIENQQETLLNPRPINLSDFIIIELLLEIDVLESQTQGNWKPMGSLKGRPNVDLFSHIDPSELQQVVAIWQEAYEWTYYNQVLNAIKKKALIQEIPTNLKEGFQALFCIDDRECSIRRYLEHLLPGVDTYGTPGFFGVPMYYQQHGAKFLTKLCPAPISPKHVVKEDFASINFAKDLSTTKKSHGLFQGWLISQTLGFWSALKLAAGILKPSQTMAATTSHSHVNPKANLTFLHHELQPTFMGYQLGFKIEEMVQIVKSVLQSIGLTQNYKSIIYIIAHGASSSNNTHYAGYDCGACSGRPGSVNARAFAFMANLPQVREQLIREGISIPSTSIFVAALHDTTTDEIIFYEEEKLGPHWIKLHEFNAQIFEQALDLNAKERARRFVLTYSKDTPKQVHEKVRLRAFSLFEPRPELNHATNAVCVIGNRNLTKGLFLDRRSFLNSYNWKEDPNGNLLKGIIKPIGPVCGGINLEYFFSRVDNQKLGAGTKLPHNVVGLIGVSNGVEGDLRPGLPWQMVEVHDPLRLLVIIEQLPHLVLEAIQQDLSTYEWFVNEWVILCVFNPLNYQWYRFRKGEFTQHELPQMQVEKIRSIEKIIESEEENLPVMFMED